MTREEYTYIRFEVIKASRLKYLFGRLDDEPRPFELAVHLPTGGTGGTGGTGARPVTIKASSEEDAAYFEDLLEDLSYEPVERITHDTDKVGQ